MILQLNDKDLGMLEERIKRAPRSKQSAPSLSTPTATQAPAAPNKRSRPSTAPAQSNGNASVPSKNQNR